MNKSLLFIDTWGWLTLYDRQESAHTQTVKFYQDFWHQKGNIYTTDYVLDEILFSLKDSTIIKPIRRWKHY